MHDARVGRVIRALRQRRRWRQVDLALRAGVAQTTISSLERGHVERTSIAVLRRVFLALDAGLDLEPRWRGGALDRLLDERHASLVGFVARALRRYGWEVEAEVTYSIYGERGSIDLLALDRQRRMLLVVEVKSELVSLEAMLRTLDAKVRLAPAIASERFGIRPAGVSRLVVAPAGATVLRRVRAADAVLGVALPARGWTVRRWLREPSGRLDGLWIVSSSSPSAGSHDRRPRERVRPLGLAPATHDSGPAPRRPGRSRTPIAASSAPGAG